MKSRTDHVWVVLLLCTGKGGLSPWWEFAFAHCDKQTCQQWLRGHKSNTVNRIVRATFKLPSLNPHTLKIKVPVVLCLGASE